VSWPKPFGPEGAGENHRTSRLRFLLVLSVTGETAVRASESRLNWDKHVGFVAQRFSDGGSTPPASTIFYSQSIGWPLTSLLRAGLFHAVDQVCRLPLGVSESANLEIGVPGERQEW